MPDQFPASSKHTGTNLPLLYRSGKTIFFAHVPKTGGTSVQIYLQRRFGDLLLLGRHRDAATKGTSLIVSATHLSALDLEELLPAHLDASFAIVRDPIKRMQSEFQFQKGTSRASRASFSTWLRLMIFAAKHDPRVYDNHIRPQSDLLPAGTKIFKLEEGIDSIIPFLDGILSEEDPQIEIPHLLKSKREEISISRQDVRLIEDYYKSDYDNFSYPKPELGLYRIDPFSWLRDVFCRPLGWAIAFWQRIRW